jgi:hypothetical protein
VVTARVADYGYNILYHNADGTIASTFEASDYSNGKVTITKSDVPDDGYVTLEEVYGTTSASSDIYMFSVQKSLLTDLVLNVQSFSDNTGNSCYSGSDYRDTTEDSDSAEVFVDISGSYYQTSYDSDSISGLDSSNHIPVASPATPLHDTLVTIFDDYDSSTGERTSLAYYGFAEPDEVYDSSLDSVFSFVTMTDVDSSEVTLTATDAYASDLDFDDCDDSGDCLMDHGIYVLHDDVTYLWQPLYSGSSFSYADSNDISTWSAYLSGSESTYSWDFESYISVDGSDIALELPSLFDVSAISVSDSCSNDDEPDYCIDIDGSYSASDYDYQRSNVYMTVTIEVSENTTHTNLVNQTIYSVATDSPIVLVNSQYDIPDTSSTTVNRIEFNLMNTDAEDTDAITYLMAQNMDEVALADGADVDDVSFVDVNGSITDADTREELIQAMLASTTTIVKNSL